VTKTYVRTYIYVYVYVHVLYIPSRKLNFDKVSFFPDGAIGLPYGSCFQVEDRQLVVVSSEPGPCVCVQLVDSASDNRAVFDDGAAQELTEQDIKAMKAAGLHGQV